MCLVIKNKKNQRPKYTIEDMVVYKWLKVSKGPKYSPSKGDWVEVEMEGPFQHTPYELNKLYTSNIEHAWDYFVYYKTNYPRCYRMLPFIFHGEIHRIKTVLCPDQITVGLHCVDTISNALIYSERFATIHWKLYKCIIPKHSWYYINDDGEIATNNLIVKKEVEGILDGEIATDKVIKELEGMSNREIATDNLIKELKGYCNH